MAKETKQEPKELTEKEKKEIEKKIKEVQKKVEKFSDKAREKFKNYILGISVLPPEKKGQEDINTIVIVDDRDSKKMTKHELQERVSKILTEMGEKEKIKPQVILQTQLWQNCYEGNYDLVRAIAISTPVFDKGTIESIKISEVHKNMVLKKFDKYIVSYVAAGGIFRGEGHEKSDIDVFIVIDDTDVKKMTRTELRDRLVSIIYQLAFEARAVTGVKRQLHVQSYLLTDFWDTLKESASPVIFTFLRDGIPFYDRGIYMPWKHLLDSGRIAPSREAIRKFNMTGDHFFEAAKKKLISVATEDLYYACLNPAQSALMMKGLKPPTHKETGRLVREVFVEKEKVLEKKYADILDNMIGMFKKHEYGEIKEISGKELEKLMKDCEDFRKRIKDLYKTIEKQSDEDVVVTIYDQTAAAAREALLTVKVTDVDNKDLEKTFKKELVETGKIPETLFKKLKLVIKAKKDYDEGDIKPSDIDTAGKESRLFVKAIIDFVTRDKSRLKEERTLKFKHEKGTGEVIVLESGVFINHDGKIEHATFKDNKLSKFKASNEEELQKALENSHTITTLNAESLKVIEDHLGSLELLI